MKLWRLDTNCLHRGAFLLALLFTLEPSDSAESARTQTNSAAHYATEFWNSLSVEQRAKIPTVPMRPGIGRGLRLSETDQEQQSILFRMFTAAVQPGSTTIQPRKWSAVNNLVYHYRQQVNSSNSASEHLWISAMGKHGTNPPILLRVQTPDLFLTVHLKSEMPSTMSIPMGTNGTPTGMRRLERHVAELAASLDAAQREKAFTLAPHNFATGPRTALRPPFPDLGITANTLKSGEQQRLLQALLTEYCYWQGEEFVDRRWEKVSQTPQDALRLAWLEDLELPNRATFLMKATNYHLWISCTLPK